MSQRYVTDTGILQYIIGNKSNTFKVLNDHKIFKGQTQGYIMDSGANVNILPLGFCRSPINHVAMTAVSHAKLNKIHGVPSDLIPLASAKSDVDIDQRASLDITN